MSATLGNRWGLLLLLTGLNILNFADRYLIIAFSTQIVPELGMSNLQFGLLTGIVFTLVYTLFGLYLGSLADRVHRPRLIAAGLALWSALTALTGLTRSFLQMASARLFVGVGEAALSPAALSMLADGFAPARRALANGIYYLGIPVGIGGSFILASWLGPWLGWRGSFIALGALGIVAALLVGWLLRDPDRVSGHPQRPTGSTAESLRALAGQVRHNRPMQWILLGCIAATCVQGAAVLDLLWWVRERGFAERTAQQLNGSMFLAGGVFGSIVGGWLADRMHARMVGGRLWFLAIAFAIGIPLMLLFRQIPADSPLFLPLAFTGNAIFMLVFGPALASLHEIVPASQRAATAALFILVTSLIGSAGGSALAGALADHFANSGEAEPLTWAIVCTQALGLLTVPAFFLAARALPGQLAVSRAAVATP
ncbi:MAG: MFS transporter [Xanthomonadales bacterium]|nr:MFS transporter [Xanthomonadales bacterium]